MHNHYVYFLLDPRKPGSWQFEGETMKFQPFYVGKGVGYRDKTHLYEKSLARDQNKMKVSTIRKIQAAKLSPIIVRVVEKISDTESVALEEKAISKFGRMLDGGILTNICKSDVKTPANSIGQENLHSKSVYQYDLDGKFLKRWDTSCRCVALEIGVAQSSLSRACKNNNTTCAGFIWSYIDLGPKTGPAIAGDQSKRVRKIAEISENGERLKEYGSAKELAKELSYDYTNIHKAIKRGWRVRGRRYCYVE